MVDSLSLFNVCGSMNLQMTDEESDEKVDDDGLLTNPKRTNIAYWDGEQWSYDKNNYH